MRDYKLSTKHYLSLALVLAVLNGFLYQHIFTPPQLSVTVFQTGKSPVVLIETPGGAIDLVNTGPDARILRDLGETLAPWQRSLDTLFITNSSSAAAGGVGDLLGRYAVAAIVRAGAQGSRGIETTFAGSGVPQAHIPYGLPVALGSNTTIALEAQNLINITHNGTNLIVSSTTPSGRYTINGQKFVQN